MRWRAHHCHRLSTGELRPLVTAGAAVHRLADGTELGLRWRPVRGCFGSGSGQSLQLLCPVCGAACRVLWRPPTEGWGCWRCHPISHASHRRPGSRRGHPKPPRWQAAQIAAEQRRTAALLGLQHWPPQKVIWRRVDLISAPRLPGAPQLSSHRELALVLRLDALETLRLALLLPEINADLKRLDRDLEDLPEWPGMDSQAQGARRLVAATAWAMRRPAGDPRSRQTDTRSGCCTHNSGIASQTVCDCNTPEVGGLEAPRIAISETTGRVPVATARGQADDSATEAKRLGADAGNARGSRVVSPAGESKGHHRQRSAAGVLGN